jgi:hypothetical protein
VPELVGAHRQRLRQAGEHASAAVAEDHLVTVPEGVVEVAPVVHHAVERHPRAVDRVPREDLEEEVPGGAEVLERLVHGGVAGVGVALAPHDRRLEVLAPRGVADHPVHRRDAQRRRRRARRADRGTARLGLGPGGAQRRADAEGVERGVALGLPTTARDLPQHVVGNEALAGVAAGTVHRLPPPGGGSRDELLGPGRGCQGTWTPGGGIAGASGRPRAWSRELRAHTGGRDQP